MSGGGGGSSTPATTTQIQDVPAWEQSYLENVMGQAQTEAAQPYNPYTGPKIAGFTPDQQAAFSGIENLGNTTSPTMQSGVASAMNGANTIGNIYNAGAGDINASTTYNPLDAVSPYLGAASQYNSAAAAQPWLNQASGYQQAAALAGTPQGIQSYMSPYTSSVVNGLVNTANQNWNQNIMPGVNNEFVGSGQYGSGRNAQVLGQAANNFQTNLNSSVANALESGYNTAGTQAANEASLLSGLGSQSLTGAQTASGAQTSQVGNLLNQAQAAGTAANQQASNLQSAGTALGNLTATQGQDQVAAGTALGNLASNQEQVGLQQNQALQAVGQQQQQLNQTNLNQAQTDYENAVNYPEQQTTYLDNIIRGINAGTSTTGSSQTTPAYSVSPLSGIGGAGTGALSLLGSNGNSLGTAVAAKRGGLIKGYAAGGVVTTDDSSDDYDTTMSPLDPEYQSLAGDDSVDNNSAAAQVDDDVAQQTQDDASNPLASSGQTAMANPLASQSAPDDVADPMTGQPVAPEDLDTPSSQHNAEAPDGTQYKGLTQADMQQQQLLALASGMLTPTLGGSGFAALGQGIGAAQNIGLQQQKWNLQQQQLQAQRNLELKKFDFEKDKSAKELDLEKEKVDQGKYTPIKDVFGNVTGVMDAKTGKMVPIGALAPQTDTTDTPIDDKPSSDPQVAAKQILAETGTPFTPVASRQDITGRNQQAKAYRDAANGAKSTVQQLDQLNAQTGKYTSGKTAGWIYDREAANNVGGKGASARIEAEKASTLLANALATSNVNAKNAGIKTIEFDAKGVPNPDMTDEARTALIEKNKAIANSQIQRAAISDMYPRMHLSNVNAIMDAYEAKNPPVLATGEANPNWMKYSDWLKAGRPDTASMPAAKAGASAPSIATPSASGQPTLVDLIAEKKRRAQING